MSRASRNRMPDAALMTPEHPLWGEFVDRLGCAARCNQTTEHSRRVLQAMVGIDVEGSLMALRDMGGVCDCSILFDLREVCAG